MMLCCPKLFVQDERMSVRVVEVVQAENRESRGDELKGPDHEFTSPLSMLEMNKNFRANLVNEVGMESQTTKTCYLPTGANRPFRSEGIFWGPAILSYFTFARNFTCKETRISSFQAAISEALKHISSTIFVLQHSLNSTTTPHEHIIIQLERLLLTTL